MKKIMFKDRYGLTDAVLHGDKTMTRRIIPLTDTDREYLETAFDFDLRESVIIDVYSRYRVGEEVAVAQSYQTLIAQGYLADDRKDGWVNERYITSPGYSNKMFVKAKYMLHRIRITGIKVERLQDISEEDAMREGIRQSVVEYGDKKIVQWTYFGEKITTWFDSPREAFAALIDRISGKGTWQRNPWVFAYEFELVR